MCELTYREFLALKTLSDRTETSDSDQEALRSLVANGLVRIERTPQLTAEGHRWLAAYRSLSLERTA